MTQMEILGLEHLAHGLSDEDQQILALGEIRLAGLGVEFAYECEHSTQHSIESLPNLRFGDGLKRLIEKVVEENPHTSVAAYAWDAFMVTRMGVGVSGDTRFGTLSVDGPRLVVQQAVSGIEDDYLIVELASHAFQAHLTN